MANVDVTRIASNIGALNALNSLQNINKQLAVHQTRLSTGKRINSAADDPAGLTIATKMLARSEGLKVAMNNIGDATNMLSVAESGMSKINDILVQMRGKAQQAASDTLGTEERQAITTQLQAFAAQIDAINAETKWNDVQLLGGNLSKRFQTGVDDGEYTTWTLTESHSSQIDGLNVSDSYSTAGVDSTAQVKGASFNDATSSSAIYTGLTALGTSTTYTAHVMEVGGTNGKVTQASTSDASVSVNTLSGAPGTAQLSSGLYKLTISGVNKTAGAGALTFTVTNRETGAVAATATQTVADGASSVDLAVGGQTIGVNFAWTGNITAGTASFANNQTMNFEYIKAGEAKFELKDASGTAVAVDADGNNSPTTNATRNYFFKGASGAYDTGRGVTINTGATLTKDHTDVFGFHQSGTNVVDVSNATNASNYMSRVNSAINKVNSHMADLGSLMARLAFKEDAVATAQVNVEASYSRIMNANMAEEQVNASKFSILQQTATAMLAQANQAPQSLLSLFR